MRGLCLLLLVLWPVAGQGQAPASLTAAALPAAVPTLAHRFAAVAPRPFLHQVNTFNTIVDGARTPAGAFAASLILPGAGQAALGQRRWVVYAVLEAAFWATHLEAAADVRRLTDAYRDLAWEAARLPTGPGERREAGWGYYETMGHYITSGRYDLDPGTAGVQPETDPTTYNGVIWDLARGIFLPGGVGDPSSPEYDDALAYYRDRAAGPDLLWDWSGSPGERDRYRSLIASSDDEARVRSTALGLVLANHLVAAVDALVVARLRTGAGIRLESRLRRAPDPRLDIGLRLPIRN